MNKKAKKFLFYAFVFGFLAFCFGATKSLFVENPRICIEYDYSEDGEHCLVYSNDRRTVKDIAIDSGISYVFFGIILGLIYAEYKND